MLSSKPTRRRNEPATLSRNQAKTALPNGPATAFALDFDPTGNPGTEMREIALVTDDDLTRARVDPEFRHRLVADNLELLLSELNRLRGGKTDRRRAKQIREGVDLAVQLAEILQRIERAPGARAS